MNVLAHADIANFIKLALYRMPAATEIQGDLTQAKIELLRRTVDTPLFSAQGKPFHPQVTDVNSPTLNCRRVHCV